MFSYRKQKKNLGRFLGIEGVMAGMEATKHEIGATMSLLSSASKLQHAAQRSERDGQELSEQEQAAMMMHGLDTVWKMGKLEIEKTVRNACKLVLKDKQTRKKRAQALMDLGTLYKKEAEKAKKQKGMEKGTFFDFVQKAQDDETGNNTNSGTSPRPKKEKNTTTNTTSTTSTTTTTTTSSTTGTKK